MTRVLKLSKIKTDDELLKLLKKSKEQVENMTPQEYRKMMQAQRKSWVIGNIMLAHPDMSREEVEKIYDDYCL